VYPCVDVQGVSIYTTISVDVYGVSMCGRARCIHLHHHRCGRVRCIHVWTCKVYPSTPLVQCGHVGCIHVWTCVQGVYINTTSSVDVQGVSMCGRARCIHTQKKIQNPCYQIRYCTNVISTGAILVSFCLPAPTTCFTISVTEIKFAQLVLLI
jgi:hypothetical protein